MPMAKDLVLMTIFVAAVIGTQTPVTPEDTILERLVWDSHMALDADMYPTPMRRELVELLARASAYRPETPAPPGHDVRTMVYAARIGYQRMLAAVAEDKNASTLARVCERAQTLLRVGGISRLS